MSLDIQGSDIVQLATLILKSRTAFADADEHVPDVFVTQAVIEVENRNGYSLGTLTYEDEQFRLTPANTQP
jgi:hypothetical protein